MVTQSQKVKVFVCHASQDKPVVRELCQRLAKEGWIDPWLDEGKILPGEDWRIAIEKAVEVAHFVVICLSNNSINKEGFIQKELRFAREISLEKPEGTVFLIPLRLDNCEIPRGLRFIQYTDYYGEDKELSYNKLINIFSKKDEKEIYFHDETDSLSPSYSPQPLRNVLSNYYDHLDELVLHEGVLSNIPTGFIDLDKLTNGLKPSNFLVVASYSNQYKTDFLISILRNASIIHKKHVLIFSPLGVSNNEFAQHLMAQETGIDLQRLSIGKITENDWALFEHAIEVMSSANIFLDNSSNLSIRHIEERSQQLKLENQIDLIIIDNLQFIKEELRESTTKNINYANLKILSHKLGVPVLTGIQLPRKAERRIDKRPQLSDLHEFSQLEDLADVIMFTHHPDLYESVNTAKSIAEIIVAKQNYGPVGAINLIYNSSIGKYENATTRTIKE